MSDQEYGDGGNQEDRSDAGKAQAQVLRACRELSAYVLSNAGLSQRVLCAHISAIELRIQALVLAHAAESTHTHYRTSLVDRLKRVEDDLAAFKIAHANHFHRKVSGPYTSEPIRLRADGTREDTANEASVKQSTAEAMRPAVAEFRTNAENRAWSVIEEWRAIESAKPENVGNVYHVRLRLGKNQEAVIWIYNAYTALDTEDDAGSVLISKRGTSRVDALAHLASWCQAEMGDDADRKVVSDIHSIMINAKIE